MQDLLEMSKGAVLFFGVLLVACQADLLERTASNSPGCEPEPLPEQTLHVVGGLYQSCAWEQGRGVWCWGDNAHGELGDGTLQSSLTPTSTQVSAAGLKQLVLAQGNSGSFGCALSASKTVQCWGTNIYGQLGDGTTVSRSTPAPVAGLSDVIALSSGPQHTCALLSNGHISCWGFGNSCELGGGCPSFSITPREVAGIADATQLTVGLQYSCALRSDATVWCWGGNAYGQVGVGHRTAVLQPAQVLDLTDVVRLEGDLFNACAQTRNGRVFCWGQSAHGFLGVHVDTDAVTRPLEIPNIPCGAIMMPGGKCAATSSGETYCWGTWIGDGSMKVADGAQRVPLDNIVALSGYRTLFALQSDGTLWAWGWNERGQLGDGSTLNQWSPVPITLPE